MLASCGAGCEPIAKPSTCLKQPSCEDKTTSVTANFVRAMNVSLSAGGGSYLPEYRRSAASLIASFTGTLV